MVLEIDLSPYQKRYFYFFISAPFWQPKMSRNLQATIIQNRANQQPCKQAPNQAFFVNIKTEVAIPNVSLADYIGFVDQYAT